MRVFFAITFDKEIVDLLTNVQQQLKSLTQTGNYTKKSNLHLTLKFIGETPASKLEILKNSMDQIANKFTAFNIKIGKLGEFKRDNNSLVWLGINQSTKLLELYNILQNNLEIKGFEKDNRKFKSHITLARKVEVKDFNKIRCSINYERKFIKVNKITLMESKRIEGVLVYKPLYEVSF